MKKFKSLFFAAACMSLMIFAACGDSGGGDDPAPSAGETQAEAISGTWTTDFTANENAITFDGQSRAEDWGSFSLTLSGASENADGVWGGTYSASGQPSGDGQIIWPSSGTWAFPSATSTQLMVRDDGVEISIVSVSETELALRFTVADPNARAAGFFDAQWSFTISKGN